MNTCLRCWITRANTLNVVKFCNTCADYLTGHVMARQWHPVAAAERVLAIHNIGRDRRGLPGGDDDNGEDDNGE